MWLVLGNTNATDGCVNCAVSEGFTCAGGTWQTPDSCQLVHCPENLTVPTGMNFTLDGSQVVGATLTLSCEDPYLSVHFQENHAAWKSSGGHMPKLTCSLDGRTSTAIVTLLRACLGNSLGMHMCRHLEAFFGKDGAL